MVPATTGEIKPVALEEKRRRKEAILAVLARAADDSEFLARLANNPSEALSEYFTLTQEEVIGVLPFIQHGRPCRSRTCDTLVRSQVLCTTRRRCIMHVSRRSLLSILWFKIIIRKGLRGVGLSVP